MDPQLGAPSMSVTTGPEVVFHVHTNLSHSSTCRAPTPHNSPIGVVTENSTKSTYNHTGGNYTNKNFDAGQVGQFHSDHIIEIPKEYKVADPLSVVEGGSSDTLACGNSELNNSSFTIPRWVNPENFDCNWLDISNINTGIKVTARDIFAKNVFSTFVVQAMCAKGTCSCLHYIGGRVSYLHPCRFFVEAFLRGDSDPDWEFILRGIIFGFKVVNPDCVSSYSRPNYSTIKSGIGYEVMNKKLLIELENGAVSIVSDQPRCTHAIFSIPKNDGSGMRAIIDCSKPYETSVNNFTDQVCTEFSYKSIDDVVDNMEQNDYIAVVDISDAYRSVSIHPSDRSYQGISWDFGEGPVHLEDNRLSMGLSSSPYIFSKISDFITRCSVREECTFIVNYLDDFAVIGRNYGNCASDQLCLIHILRRLGFNVSFKKLLSPSQTVRFLGIEISTINLELRLPSDKISRLHRVLDAFYIKKRATRRDLERLGGLLAHCSKVVRGGRSFSSRIYDAIRVTRKPFYMVRLNKDFKSDIFWWRAFVEKFNGIRRLLGRHAPFLSVYSDASSEGFGALHDSDWCAGSIRGGNDQLQVGHHWESFDPSILDMHINVLEMYAIMVAARRWSHLWEDRNVVFVTDNTTVRAALNLGKSRNKQIMSWVRELFWLSAETNFTISSVYVPSKDNIICDALSRWGDSSSKARIAAVDPQGLLCCSHLFV